MSQTAVQNTVKDATTAAAIEAAKAPMPKITSRVLDQITQMQSAGRITIPADYNVANALTSAWLVLQTTMDMNQNLLFKNGVLDESIGTQNSLVNALHDMVVQGMNVAKKQGYFIIYGKTVTFQRSYFGDVALAIRLNPNMVPYGDVIRKGDDFAPCKVRNRYGLITVVGKHVQAWPRKSDDIIGCYVGAVMIDPETGEATDMGMELMDIDQIRMSWTKSKTYKPGGNTFHNQQPDQACLRTVSRRWAKPIINSSGDQMLIQSVRRQSEDAVFSEVEETAALNGNGEVLSLSQGSGFVDPNPDEKIGTPPADDKPKDLF